jgi:exonuclease SbcC
VRSRDDRAADLRAQKARSAETCEGNTRALIERFLVHEVELKNKQVAVGAQVAVLAEEQDRLHAELARTAEASQQAAAQQTLLNNYRVEWDGTTAALSRCESLTAELDRRRRDYAGKRGELGWLNEHIGALRADLQEWLLLQKALGKDGLPVLEIDAAGPTVAAYANDLLQACGLGRFTIDLVTERPKAKGKDGSTMKDVFEVRVYDADRPGGARDISDLSGGEEVLVDTALRSAIALLVNQRHAFPIRTCWRDESTGALDPLTAMRYMSMLRRVHELGGFHQTIFISHNPDACLLADAQVVFGGGTFEVQLPPYGRSEVEAA